MDIQIPKIFETLSLSGYAPEFGPEQTIRVWVNPPRRLVEEWDQLVEGDYSEAAHQQMNTILAQLWDCPLEEVAELEARCMDQDPGLLAWMIRGTWSLIIQHRLAIKKN